MNKGSLALGLAAAVFLASGPVGAEPAKPSSPAPANAPSLRPAYDSFRLVHTRNVFDPDRRPVRPANSAPPASAAPTRLDYAALTGTMLSEDKSYAFFSGSRPEFNKVLGMQGKIANATIAGITATSIEIERDGKRTTVAVGQTVPLDNQTAPGEPPADAPDAGPPAAAVSSPAPGPGPAGTPPPAAVRPATATPTAASPNASKGPPANIDEIRRRMMEKRQQELK